LNGGFLESWLETVVFVVSLFLCFLARVPVIGLLVRTVVNHLKMELSILLHSCKVHIWHVPFGRTMYDVTKRDIDMFLYSKVEK